MAPLSVALVAIVLGAAFGELLGLGAFIGMISAFVALLCTSVIGGSPFGITSPTGPMTAAASVVLLASSDFSADMYPLVLLVSAGFLVLFALTKVTSLVQHIPNVVVAGFVNGIALLIAIQQLNSISNTADGALMAATAGLALIMGRGLKTRAHVAWRILASTASVVLIASVIAAVMPYTFTYPMTEAASFQAVIDALHFPSMAGFSGGELFRVGLFALEVALIALFDTLLTSLLMERQTSTPHQHRREVLGQAASIAAVSTFSGVPSAQSTVPSMMYYQEGARGRTSRIALVLCALGLVLVGSRLIPFVPDAVLSGIILKIALDIADITSFRAMLHSRRRRDQVMLLFFSLGTITATVFFSLNAAVIGFAVSFIVLNKTLLKNQPIPDLVFDHDTQGIADEL